MKKNRDKEGLFIVEGSKIVSEFIELYPDQIEFIAGSLETHLFDRQFLLNDAELKELSSFKTPSNLIAVVQKPKFELKNKGVQIVLDGIQDPGNMGTIIRTADWFGVSEIICSKETVDCFNPKVIQASMGSIFRVNVHYVGLIDYLTNQSERIFLAAMDGQDYQSVDFPDNAIIVLGNEGNGISDDIFNLGLNKITIPRIGKAESLNVALANGIILSKIAHK